ncbi:MAG: type II toxin-antitoxin system ParD family antitoxin [Alcanivoracaceae bacterium]|nr:type II toxin-antitoxin system ParD family antitoxin [Alcanivoracaceae bacterium]
MESNLQIQLLLILLKFIDDSIESGYYKTTSEVVREGLRLLQEKQAESKLKMLQKLIKEGEDSGIAVDWNFEDFQFSGRLPVIYYK